MKLLIVEDDKRMAGYLRQGLIEEGYAIDVAYDGEQGLDLTGNGIYDLIVLDVILPGKDGTEVCRELRTSSLDLTVGVLSKVA